MHAIPGIGYSAMLEYRGLEAMSQVVTYLVMLVSLVVTQNAQNTPCLQKQGTGTSLVSAG